MFDEIHTHFQPVVGLRTGEPFAYEAFSRGPSDEGVFDPRSLFMAAAEQTRLVELDVRCMDVAIERAVEQGLLKVGAPALFMNSLPDTLHSSGFTEWLEKALVEAGAEPSGLIIEVNDGWRIQDYQNVRAVLSDLRSIGVRAAVDDAGAGHSGLQVLAELRPDFVKIDKTLIRGVHDDAGRQAILEMFLVLADRLDVALIAEGVEDSAELAVIDRMNIDYVQGYLIGRPGPTLAMAEGWKSAHADLIRTRNGGR